MHRKIIVDIGMLLCNNYLIVHRSKNKCLEIKMMELEKSLKLGKDLYDLNSGTINKLFTIDAESIDTFMDVNKSFGDRMPNIKGFSEFVEMQQDYGKALWDESQSVMSAKSEIVQDAMEQAKTLMADFYPPSAPTVKKAVKKTGSATT